MLDKRLYRDVSDLLELGISDDKIIRIVLVRGYTTEQIKRSIKEIRSKAPKEEIKHKSALVSETIEAGPSKRFGFLNKIFNRSITEEDLLAEEARRLADEERKLKDEESKIRSDLQKVIEKAKGIEGGIGIEKIKVIPDDVRNVLKMVDELLGKLPEKDVKKFVASPKFAQYKKVMKKYS